MLVAYNSEKTKKAAFEAEKQEKPFFCPACSEEVILKKGKVREHHYAHFSDTKCAYGKGESQLHYKVKREIYLSLKDRANCSKCELERVLKGVRPDVSLVINNNYVAIEVQNTSISIEEINRRFEKYSELGIHLIWVFPQEKPKCFSHGEFEDEVCKVKIWEQHIHDIQQERVYYWTHGGYVVPYHYAPYFSYKEQSNWYNSNGDEQSAGGYWEEKKTIKTPLRCPSGEIHIADNFEPDITVFSGKYKTCYPPKSKVFICKNKYWWGKYYDDIKKLF
jgi:competence protein CoiA